MMEDLVLFLFYMIGMNGIFLAAGFAADYILPHIPFIDRYLDSLPNWDDD